MNTAIDLQEVLHQGMVHHQAGRLDQAELAYRKILEAEPGHADTNHLLGVLAYQRGQHEEAIRLISKAIEAVPANSPGQYAYYCNLGNALKDQGRLDNAVEAYSKALDIETDNPETLNNLGTVLRQQGRLDDAVERYRKAIGVKPDYADALYNLGNALKEKGNFDEAVALFRRALKIQPGYV